MVFLAVPCTVVVTLRGDEDVVAFRIQVLLAIVRARMVIVRSVVHEVFCLGAHAVVSDEELVRLGVVVVLRQGDEEGAVLATDIQVVLLAVFDGTS